MGENSSALGSIPSTECLRSITSLVHLPLPSATAVWLRRKTASVICVSIIYAGCGLTRSSTAIERPDFSPGDVGSIPIGSVNLDGPLSLGYLVKILPWRDERVRTPRHRATDGFPTRPLSVFHFSTGRRIGLSLITTWSLVRVQSSAPDAGVAQWVEHVIPSSFFIRRNFRLPDVNPAQ